MWWLWLEAWNRLRRRGRASRARGRCFHRITDCLQWAVWAVQAAFSAMQLPGIP